MNSKICIKESNFEKLLNLALEKCNSSNYFPTPNRLPNNLPNRLPNNLPHFIPHSFAQIDNVCPPGTYKFGDIYEGGKKVSNCLDCDPGFYCEGGSSMPNPCPEGTYSEARASVCHK